VIDVAVIGGGPAGSAAALAAARAGLETVLFEARAPEGKPARVTDDAEESVGPDCAALLQSFGVDGASTGTPFAGIATGPEVAVFGGARTVAGLHLRRSRLDCALRTAAARAGAELRIGTEVLGLTFGCEPPFRFDTTAGPVAAHRLIDATGRGLWLTRRLTLGRRRLSPPLIAWRDIVSSEAARTGAFARFTPHPDGWTWLAEVSANRIVRIRLLPARGAQGTSGIPVPRRGTTAHAATWHLVRQLAGLGWFIAGEAAAALDPAAGSGIAFALRSGLAAGRAAAASIVETALAPVIAARYHDALSREAESGAATLAQHYRRLGIGVLEYGSLARLPK
jgi:flavin-dependent dehydrogenase